MQSISQEFRSAGIKTNKIEQTSGIWQISAAAEEAGVWPTCLVRSRHRQGHYWRKLADSMLDNAALKELLSKKW